ncbi:hypothetical protein LG634_05400 [Streptomyces bambusae]|uniref:hypothetical protein n=1 Tax=Streptomyces bambusae TaxID=1550616 RepID=UPI001CFEC203|nr:hypothetical protein [Streptomyces bambusae]MCB5164274.1 hypothetical protein [Streptomyces bambusae]
MPTTLSPPARAPGPPWPLRALAGAAAAVLLAGCGAPAGRRDGARDAGAAFERALAAADHRAACALLVPATRARLEQDESKPCPDALPGQHLPQGGAVRTTEVYGRQALLKLTADTLFLSQFRGGWKVAAAGCTPRGEQPYSCTVEGQ